MNTLNLVGVLRAMASAIEEGDSYEGSIEYHALPEPDQYEVEGVFRRGNRDGQGSVILIKGGA
jgi:hypothetical protein